MTGYPSVFMAKYNFYRLAQFVLFKIRSLLQQH